MVGQLCVRGRNPNKERWRHCSYPLQRLPGRRRRRRRIERNFFLCFAKWERERESGCVNLPLRRCWEWRRADREVVCCCCWQPRWRRRHRRGSCDADWPPGGSVRGPFAGRKCSRWRAGSLPIWRLSGSWACAAQVPSISTGTSGSPLAPWPSSMIPPCGSPAPDPQWTTTDVELSPFHLFCFCSDTKGLFSRENTEKLLR